MVFNLYLILSIIWLHFVADYIFQSSWMASNKSSDTSALLSHVACYTLTLGVGGFILSLGDVNDFLLPWVILNGVLHFTTDYIFSKISTKLLDHDDLRMVFVMDGLDKCVHYTCLFGTIGLVNNHLIRIF